jgi:hypothetical protein
VFGREMVLIDRCVVRKSVGGSGKDRVVGFHEWMSRDLCQFMMLKMRDSVKR